MPTRTQLAALAVAALAAAPPLPAQHEDHAAPDGHRTFGHSHSLLLSAPLRGAHAVPAVATGAGGTGAFVLTGEEGRFELRYSLSWDGLANPQVVGVELRNFGAGGNGEVVHGLCGAHSTTACPAGRGATLAGVWTSDDRQPLTGDLVSELAAGRIYAVVRTARHRQGEIRGQLSGQPFMAHAESFVVRFGHAWEGGPEVETGAGGTGAFHLVAIGDGREILLYDLTVVGAGGRVTGFSIVPGGAAKAAPAPALAVRARGDAAGSLTGRLGEVDPARAKSVGTEALTSSVLADGWVVVTTADGEVRGEIEVLR